MSIYEQCPILECERFSIRPLTDNDCDDLLKVYSDKLALPFFNSDNCNGDNFYYSTKERMAEAVRFWHTAYGSRWFARLSVIDRKSSCVIGTVELCLRTSDDAFDGMGIVRVDVKSDYEREDALYDIFSLLSPRVEEMLGCKGMITKAPAYAVERIKALQRAGFTKSEHFLFGQNGVAYDGYWIMK